MHDAALVCRLHRRRDLLADLERFVDGQCPPPQPLRERFSFHQLEHQVARVADDLESVDPGDVGVRQRSEQARLAFETRQPLGVARELQRQRLDRDVTTESRVLRAIHLAHAAGAERGDDLVRPET